MGSDAPAEVAWRQLHPASVAVNLIPRAWRMARASWPIFLALLFGGRGDASGAFELLLLLTFFGMTVTSSVVHWATLRYRVAGGRLEIVSGLLNRQTRVIDPRRIQNLERVRNLFQRAGGLVEVRIETASGTEVEGLLSALSEAEAAALIGALEEARRAVGIEDEATEEIEGLVLVDTSVGDLLTYGATAARFGAGAVVVVGLSMEGLQLLSPDEVQDVSGFLAGGAILLIGLAVVTGTWVMGVLASLARHWGFRLVQRGDGLVATEGLFTQRRVELKRDKIQLVSVREPFVRRALGFGSVLIETAAAREREGGTVSAEAMAPVVHRDQFHQVIDHAIPGTDAEILEQTLRPPHPHALKRALFGGGVRAVVFSAVIAWWLWPWGLLALAAIPLSLTTAWLDYRYQGWIVGDRVIVARQGYLLRVTAIVPRDKLQSLELRQGLFRRRWGIGVLVLRVAGSQVRLPDLGWDEAVALQRALSRRG